MKPLQTSSGDLLADRRADYAEMLFALRRSRGGGGTDARRAGTGAGMGDGLVPARRNSGGGGRADQAAQAWAWR